MSPLYCVPVLYTIQGHSREETQQQSVTKFELKNLSYKILVTKVECYKISVTKFELQNLSNKIWVIKLALQNLSYKIWVTKNWVRKFELENLS